VKKSDREIMEILEAFDATQNANSAAELAGVDPKSVRRYVAQRDAGRPMLGSLRRERITDPFLPKIEEWAERTKGRTWSTSGWSGWGSPGPSVRRAGRSPRRSGPGGPRRGARSGRGSPSRALVAVRLGSRAQGPGSGRGAVSEWVSVA
jgi:hypothetical protein